MKQWQLVVPYGCRWAEQNDPPIHLGDQEPQKDKSQSTSTIMDDEMNKTLNNKSRQSAQSARHLEVQRAQ
jgi:hypothetical protein